MAKQKRRIYCKFCDYFCYEPEDFVSHLEKHHDEMIPEDMSPWQFSYYLRTGKTHGNCIVCKKETSWNEKTHKYNRFCNNPKCKEKYREVFKNRMIGKYGKTHLLNDPEQQKKMLANRKISGEYTWRDHITKTTYTGSYEKSFLEFLDEIMNFDPSDIMAPSPHTYYYEYQGEKHFYIPDFFIPSLNLEIEIKDGGDNVNQHPKIQAVDKVKEKLKDEVMMKNQFNYIKITNQNNEKFFEFLNQAKYQFFEKNEKPIYMTEKEMTLEYLNKIYTESVKDPANIKEYHGIVTENHDESINSEVKKYISIDDIYEETHFDTLLTRPKVYFNKSIKMYHYSNTKKDEIIPITVNAGNKLAKPRFSSWWTPQRSQSGWILSNVLFSKFPDCKWEDVIWHVEEFNIDGMKYKAPKTIISQSFFDKHEDFIKSIDIFEHEKTFKGSDLGRGNEYSVDEFTCDFAVKPDKVRRIPFDELIKMIKIVPDDKMPEYKKDFNYMRVHNISWQDVVHKRKPWLYWEFDVSNNIRAKYCKDHGIDFKVDEEYFRYTYQGIGIYEAFHKKLIDEKQFDVWKKFLNSSASSWLPKPDYYSKTCLSYFTEEGRNIFIKKVLPLFEKYLGEGIEFSKTKNIKNIVYKDKYQVVIDISKEGEK